jgi:glycine oxidase
MTTSSLTANSVTVAGAGILGLWQALALARDGCAVKLIEESPEPFVNGASRHAGAMLAPDSEAEAAPPIVRDLGRQGVAIWREIYPHVVTSGSLIVAAPRDQPEIQRFANLTTGHRQLSETELANFEPDLAGRFRSALYFPDEAHVAAIEALEYLLAEVRAAGVDVRLGERLTSESEPGLVIDCRGLAAKDDLPALRGVRGERILLRTQDLKLSRPVRLLHPRHPLYVVPWSGGRFLIGATMIESEDRGPITVRSALELLGAAFALNPGFGEAEIVETGAEVRPAFPDNVPRIVVRDGGRRLFVNGAYRHGFLLAPVLAKAVVEYLKSGASHPLIASE